MAILYTIFNSGTGLGVLVNHCANGGLAGDGIDILEIDPIAKVDITGIGSKVFEAMPVVQCTGLVETMDEGRIIIVMSQYAH